MVSTTSYLEDRLVFFCLAASVALVWLLLQDFMAAAEAAAISHRSPQPSLSPLLMSIPPQRLCCVRDRWKGTLVFF